ncbi:putative type IV secretion system protein, partial [Ehrlichia ruminantium]
AVEMESSESKGIVDVTEEQSDSAASSGDVDVDKEGKDDQFDQTSVEEQDKAGGSEDTSIDKEVSEKPDMVEPVQEDSDSVASSGDVDVDKESKDGQFDQTSMEEQDKARESEGAEDTSIDKEVGGKADIVEPAQEGNTEEESTSVLDEDNKRDVEESEEEGHDTSSDEGTEVDEVDSDGDNADMEKGPNDTLENDLEVEESKVELTEELAVKDMPEDSVTEGHGMRKASVVNDDISDGLAAVHQVDSGREFKLQEKMGLEGAQSIHVPKSLKSEEKDSISKKSSTAKKTESTDSKDNAKDKKGTSTSNKPKKTSLPKIMSGVKILVNQYAKQISTGLSESFDKFFEDTESKKRGKRKHSKEDIESMVRDLEQLLVSLKDKKSKLTDPSEIANIEDDIRKLESTIKSILDNQ